LFSQHESLLYVSGNKFISIHVLVKRGRILCVFLPFSSVRGTGTKKSLNRTSSATGGHPAESATGVTVNEHITAAAAAARCLAMCRYISINCSLHGPVSVSWLLHP